MSFQLQTSIQMQQCKVHIQATCLTIPISVFLRKRIDDDPEMLENETADQGMISTAVSNSIKSLSGFLDNRKMMFHI